jgi:mannose-6-phosphate isomerase
MYPLRFGPIYEYRLWGGRRLSNLLSEPLPGDGPIGEAWILSDRDDHMSHVTNEPFRGRSLGELWEQFPTELMGESSRIFPHFPLLLKFLDCQRMLSVPVHPTAANMDLVPAGATPKTEAWVVLEAEAESRIIAGLKPGTTPVNLLQAIATGKLADRLSSFTPKAGDAVFIPAGTVHTLGNNVVVFEIQQNSGVTFRLYDWGHVDAQTGKPRELQVDQAIACIDFKNGAAGRVSPTVEARTPVDRERLFNCDFFRLWRLHGESPFNVGAPGELRLLLCLEGAGQVEYNGSSYGVGKGEVWLLPAEVGDCAFHPQSVVNLLEIAIPKQLTTGRQQDVLRAEGANCKRKNSKVDGS